MDKTKKTYFILALLFVFIAAFVLFAYNLEYSLSGNEREYQNADDLYVYELPSYFSLFTADENGTLYALSEISGTDERLPVELMDDSYFNKPRKYINVYALDGQLTYEFEISGSEGLIEDFTISKDVIYAVAYSPERDRIDIVNRIYLNNIDLETGVVFSENFILPDYFEYIKNIEYFDGRLYIMGIHRDYQGSDDDYQYYPPMLKVDENFHYDGAILASYDIEGGFEIVYDNLPVNFSITPQGKIIINSYEIERKEFCLLEIDAATQAEINRHYIGSVCPVQFDANSSGVVLNKIETVDTDFPIIADKNDEYFPELKGLLLYYDLANEEEYIEISSETIIILGSGPRLSYQKNIQCANGFTFLRKIDEYRAATLDDMLKVTRIKDENFLLDPLYIDSFFTRD